MEQLLVRIGVRQNISRYIVDFSPEVLRKSIHLLIGFVPLLAAWNLSLTLALLSTGIIGYAYCETMRMQGYEISIISRLTLAAARKRDMGKFVMGPVTLGLGALISLILYPEPAAAIAIYALAFGDGLSSLVGKMIGTVRLPFTGGKTLEGSMACFVSVLVCAYRVSGKVLPSLLLALVATVAEAIPSKDWDNVLLPVVVGLVAVTIL